MSVPVQAATEQIALQRRAAGRRNSRPPAGVSGRSGGQGIGYFFIIPCVGLFLLFIGYPLVRSIYLSLTQWPGFGPTKFVGFQNFSAMFHDPTALKFPELCVRVSGFPDWLRSGGMLIAVE